MTHSDTQPLNPSPRPRRTKIVVASIVCVATIAALVWYRERIDFGILRFRTKTSFVTIGNFLDGEKVFSLDGKKTAFSLDEKQTREILNLIDRRTHTYVNIWADLPGRWTSVLCMDSRSGCLRVIYVHKLNETERGSADVLEELSRIAERGVPEDPDSFDDLRKDAALMERVY